MPQWKTSICIVIDSPRMLFLLLVLYLEAIVKDEIVFFVLKFCTFKGTWMTKEEDIL